MTLTKVEIVESVHNQIGLPKNKSTEIVETLIEIIKSTLASGEDVLISNFGKFDDGSKSTPFRKVLYFSTRQELKFIDLNKKQQAECERNKFRRNLLLGSFEDQINVVAMASSSASSSSNPASQVFVSRFHFFF